eukprot:scaffold291150_cov33-Attheya_sp.AAC.2
MADKVRETANKRRKTRERAQATTLATGIQGTTPGAPAQGHSQYGQPTGHSLCPPRLPLKWYHTREEQARRYSHTRR